MRTSLIAFMVLTTPLLANTPQTKTLQIYSNDAFLSYDFRVENGEFSTKIPNFVNLQNLSIQSECVVAKSSIVKLEKEVSSIGKEIKALEEKQEKLNQKYDTLKAQNELLKSIKLTSNSLKNIKKDTQEFSKVYLANLQNLSKEKKQIDKLQEKLDSLLKQDSKNSKNQFFAKLNCTSKSHVRLTFPLPNIKKRSVVRFDANSDKNSLQITQKLFLTHSFGELLKGVNIRLYSSAYNNSLEPYRFYPNYLQESRKYSKRHVKDNEIVAMSAPVMMDEVSVSSQKRGVNQDLTTKRVWDIKHVNLEAGKENEVVFNTQKIDAKYQNFIDGYGSVRAYLQANFTPREYIGGGEANFMLDGALIGKRYVHELIPKKEAFLYFGQNNFIQIEKELLEKMSDSSFFGTSKNVKTLWKYIVTNRSKKAQKIEFAERLPISQDKKIIVKQIGSLKPRFISKQGEVAYDFELKGSVKKTFTFGYEVERPTK